MSYPQARQEPSQTRTRSFSQDPNVLSQLPIPPSSRGQQTPWYRSALSWRPAANVSQSQLELEQTKGDTTNGLTFFQKHFTRPVAVDPEKRHSPQNRRFAVASHGFIIAATAMLLILFAIIGAVLGTELYHPYKHSKGESQDPQNPDDGSQGGSTQLSPIRAALTHNFPDPALIYADDTWYAFATNNAAGILQRPDNMTSYEYGSSNVQVATSTNFVDWTLLSSRHDPLPNVGAWAVQGSNNRTSPPIPRANVWAPSVIKRQEDDKYLLYYTATRNKLDFPPDKIRDLNTTDANEAFPIPDHPVPHCIGAALSRTTSPLGPYDPVNSTLACPISKGGAIDPAAFRDEDGTFYVLYKIDGNNIGHGGSCGNTESPIVPTPIMLQKMRPGGLEPDGEPIKLLDRIKDDGPLIEAPELIRSDDGIYFLFFSSGCTRAASYDVKYATSSEIGGPYKRAKGKLLKTEDFGLLAPGSVGISRDGEGGWRMAFHARETVEQGKVRALFTTGLQLTAGRAKVVRDGGGA